MVIRDYPEEIKKLMEIYEPFIVNHELVNPSPEALEAFKKVQEWSFAEGQ